MVPFNLCITIIEETAIEFRNAGIAPDLATSAPILLSTAIQPNHVVLYLARLYRIVDAQAYQRSNSESFMPAPIILSLICERGVPVI